MIQMHLLSVQIRWKYVYKNIDDDNLNRKTKILIVFDDIIADIMTNKNYHAKIEKLF